MVMEHSLQLVLHQLVPSHQQEQLPDQLMVQVLHQVQLIQTRTEAELHQLPQEPPHKLELELQQILNQLLKHQQRLLEMFQTLKVSHPVRVLPMQTAELALQLQLPMETFKPPHNQLDQVLQQEQQVLLQ